MTARILEDAMRARHEPLHCLSLGVWFGFVAQRAILGVERARYHVGTVVGFLIFCPLPYGDLDELESLEHRSFEAASIEDIKTGFLHLGMQQRARQNLA